MQTHHHEHCGCHSCREHNHKNVALEFTSDDSNANTVIRDLTWTGTTGQSAFITYSFDNTFSLEDRAAARQALSEWSSLANVTFSEQRFNGDIEFTRYSFASPFVAGEAFITFSGQQILDVEVRIADNEPTISAGSEGYYILHHEIGHALGLKHSGDYGVGDPGPFLNVFEDNTNATVMSYNLASLNTFPITPMTFDVSAVQFLYGANTSTNTGNDVYTYGGENRNSSTIYDAGGTDVLSAQFSNAAALIDLESGIEHMSQIGNEDVFIADTTIIENAEGSSNNDTVLGNSQANMLFGRAGADIVNGRDGQDTVFGGVGVVDATDSGDTLYGGHGNDELYGNAGNDVIHGGIAVADPDDGNDLAYGGKGFDLVYGNAGNDTLYGGGSGFDPLDESDTIYGGRGADLIFGNGNDDLLIGGGDNVDPLDQADTIYGGAGNDFILGNGGNDHLYGQTGNDTMHAGLGDDQYRFDIFSDGNNSILFFEGVGTSGGDTLMFDSTLGNNNGIFNALDVLSRTNYADGQATVTISSNFTITIDGIGTATLTESDIGFF